MPLAERLSTKFHSCPPSFVLGERFIFSDTFVVDKLVVNEKFFYNKTKPPDGILNIPLVGKRHMHLTGAY